MRKTPRNLGMHEDWYDGYDAFCAGVPLTHANNKKCCPYPVGSGSRNMWLKGWWAALEDSGKLCHFKRIDNAY